MSLNVDCYSKSQDFSKNKTETSTGKNKKNKTNDGESITISKVYY